MSFQTIGDAAEDAAFQRRCKGCFIKVAAAIIAAPLAGGSITAPVTNADLTTQACKDLALNYCKGTALFTSQALASLMLLSTDVAAKPLPGEQDAGFADAEYALEYQMQFMWMRLVDINQG